MAKLYTIKPIEWEQQGNNLLSKNTFLQIYIYLSLVDLETYSVQIGISIIGENMNLDEAKLLAEKEHQKFIEHFLIPVTE